MPGEGGGRAAHPQLDGLVLDLLVAVPQEGLQVVADLVVDVVEPLELGGAVERLPLGRVAGRPLLTGGRLAMDLEGDGFPGVAGRAHLGGDGDQVVQVLAHGEASGERVGWLSWSPKRKRGRTSPSLPLRAPLGMG
jgi:hypothetical protein